MTALSALPFIVVVSGLPRSGTSLMMQILEAGGIPPLTDGQRVADEDNPRGYYELDAARRLKEDARWLEQARGKAVKLVSMLLYHLPAEHAYKIVFMERELGEVLASQRRMLQRSGKDSSEAEDRRLRQLFERHLADIRQYLGARPELDVLYVSHRRLVESPREEVARLVGFLGLPLDLEAMSRISDRSLYRNRGV